jgi:hypothetical protein
VGDAVMTTGVAGVPEAAFLFLAVLLLLPPAAARGVLGALGAAAAAAAWPVVLLLSSALEAVIVLNFLELRATSPKASSSCCFLGTEEAEEAEGE